MRAILITLLAVCLLASCEKNDNLTVPLTYDNFQSELHADMSYQDIVKTFGEPQNDIGSGIHIYVYTLNDSSEIWIGYDDSIQYAHHMDQDQNFIQTLL